MPEDDLQTGVGVEHPAQDKAQPLRRGLDREAPGSTQDAGMRLRVPWGPNLEHWLLQNLRSGTG